MTDRGWDEKFRVLQSVERRRVLLAIYRRDPDEEPLTVPVTDRDGEEGANRAIDLFHNHLPRLADAGFVRWDRETSEVVRGPRFEEIRPLLDLIEEGRDERPDDRS